LSGANTPLEALNADKLSELLKILKAADAGSSTDLPGLVIGMGETADTPKEQNKVREKGDTEWHENNDGSGSQICRDEQGRVNAIKYPNGDQAAFDYDKDGNLVGYRRLNKDGSEVVMEKYPEYDPVTGEPKGPATWHAKITDAEGNVVAQQELPPNSKVSVYQVFPAGALVIQIPNEGRDSYLIYETTGETNRRDELPGGNTA